MINPCRCNHQTFWVAGSEESPSNTPTKTPTQILEPVLTLLPTCRAEAEPEPVVAGPCSCQDPAGSWTDRRGGSAARPPRRPGRRGTVPVDPGPPRRVPPAMASLQGVARRRRRLPFAASSDYFFFAINISDY